MSDTTSLSPKRRIPYQLKVRLVQIGAVAVILAGWLYAQGPGGVSRIILPPLQNVAAEFWGFITSATIYYHIRVTMMEIFVALFIAGLAGLTVGFWAARSPVRSRVLEPLLVWGYLVPSILFYPLFVLWFGFGITSKIAYAAASSFPPIAFSALRAFRRVDERHVRVGRAFGASPRQLDWSIKLRSALPMVTAGLRIGAALCMITVVVAEMLASSRGLGFLITSYSASFAAARTYAIIFVLLLVVAVFQTIVKRVLGSDPPIEVR